MGENAASHTAADVVVIGGGLIGGAIALRLAQAKMRVTVLDRGQPGAEASSAAAGMLAPQGETVEPDGFFKFCAASRDLYPAFTGEVEELSGDRVGYCRNGTVLVGINDDERAELDSVYEGQTRHGLPLERLTGSEVHNRVAGLSQEIRQGLFIAGDQWVDNERLTQAVLTAARRAGATVCGGRPVERLHASHGRVESVTVRTGAGEETVPAGTFVLAAGCWSGELVKPIGISLPLKPCRGQMIEFESPEEISFVVRSGIHYIVPRSPGKVLAGTTAEYTGFEKAVTREGLQSIHDGVARLAPFVKRLKRRRTWAGLRPDTPDHLPALGFGRLENLIIATGHFRNGILLAPITAEVVRDLVLSGSTRWPIEPYRPARFLN